MNLSKTKLRLPGLATMSAASEEEKSPPKPPLRDRPMLTFALREGERPMPLVRSKPWKMGSDFLL